MIRNVLLCAVSALFLFGCGSDEEPAPEASQVPECLGGKCDVIGDDDRYDEFSGEVTELLRETARSTAMLIETEKLRFDGDVVGIDAQTLGETYFLCPGEAFEAQPSAGFCTGWLVAPDVMVTNGHCLTSQQHCESTSFVFDYAYQEEGDDLSTVPAQNVVACERVLAWDYTSQCEVDFAVVQLARPVDRTPLKVRASSAELNSDALVIIGHPFGLPRKYALVGDLLREGTNNFSTTHDIFGGNSGSAIFDGNTGEVQGLATCGGSNLTWEYVDEGWELERKTGNSCDTTCDDEGLYVDGSWEECTDAGTRRRCVCDDDGTQLVWEKRDCLDFEVETQGQCSRESQTPLDVCIDSPWRCATPISQHTRHFRQYTDAWTVWENTDLVEVPVGTEVTSTITIEDEGIAQGFTVYVDVLGDGDPDAFAFESLALDLTVTLERGDEVFTLVDNGTAWHGTAVDLLSAGTTQTQPFQVPFVIDKMLSADVAGVWTLRVSNAEFAAHTIHGWRIQAVVKPDASATDLGLVPCTEGCVSGYEEGPPPISEEFNGDAVALEGAVSGTVAEGWTVEAIDASGVGYEAVKTRRSQTISLQRGEIALTRDFGAEIGGRVLTVDYRYDGDGWFQIWADGQILHAQQAFAQQQVTVPMPYTARKLKFVLGATDDSRWHEATIHSLTIAANTSDPASCAGVYECTSSCADATCQDTCFYAGTQDAQTEFTAVIECINAGCAGLAEPAEYQGCINTTCAESMGACLN